MSTPEVAPVHVYEPHKHALPPLGPYLSTAWRRRAFAVQLARTSLRARHYDTALGQLWSVVNPLLLALIYYLVVAVILGASSKEDYLPFLLSGLFAFYFTRNAVAQGAASVTSSGKLLLNTSFPRVLLPLSAVLSALLMYVPTLIVYAVIHVATGQPIGWQLLFVLPIIAIHAVFNAGLAMLFAALTVYYRDVASLLPYLLRIWLYLSPVLYAVDDVPSSVQPFLAVNPMYVLLGAWHDVIINGQPPEVMHVLAACGWAVAAVAIGGFFYLSREREFAVRL